VAPAEPDRGRHAFPPRSPRSTDRAFRSTFHAAGDGAAVREAVEAIAAARRANGNSGPHHEIGHNTFIDLADVPKGSELHFTWSFRPISGGQRRSPRLI